MICVLDTHAWIWWASDPDRLSARARAAVEEADELVVSAISCWEVAMLEAHGRLELDRDVLLWIRQALALPKVVLAPLSPEMAVASTRFEDPFPADPADRIIAATARERRAALVTKDRRLRLAKAVDTLW